ncbi:hypothetical protein [Umezawaea tangerina]|uniref:Uncharacterized protein n=1 Tax=Umezawaea tangerina TaxID=84725 RepID=A0A2T0T6V7_9PSEU|nr:hypothetical protein [Umezawaea tangerina]PRY41405.1 hypothetical protein CLV43_105163 [Umezawaea tangerina]
MKAGRVARWSLFGAVAMYVWGFFNSLAVPDIEDTCRGRGQPWVPTAYNESSLFPLSNPCNPNYDLVPPYVNPLFFALLALSVVFTVVVIVQRANRGKT